MTKKTIILSARIDPEVLKDFESLAKCSGLDRSGYLKLWISVIRRLKKEHALSALSSIPPEMLKGFAGRPTDAEAGKVS